MIATYAWCAAFLLVALVPHWLARAELRRRDALRRRAGLDLGDLP
jgi:hypothetical protein